MKFLKDFKLFEDLTKLDPNLKINPYDDLMGGLLHLYGSIPLQKEKARIVISKIIYNTRGKYYNLGENVIIRHQADHDKVRFKDYFDSLLSSKDSRGHNFEGTLAGLYNGELSTRGEKWDLKIDGKTWSVKFIDNPSKAPEIGSFQKILKDKGLENEINDEAGLTNLFKSNNNELKLKVFNIIADGITGGWIISYPVLSKRGENINIQMNIISVDQMRKMFVDMGMSVAPKAGIKSYFTLALSARFKANPDIIKSLIEIPKLPLSGLRRIARTLREDEWSQNIFGEYGSKIRPDVLRFIKNNSDEIANRLIKFKEFNYEIPKEI
jgi:hypothetical protein